MGNGIAHVMARAGLEVTLCEVERRFLDRGLETLRRNLDREVAKDKLTAEQAATTLGRVRGTLNRDELLECSFVIEAATEKFEVKREVFRELDSIMPPEVILASNNLLHLDYEAGRTDCASGSGSGDALL